MKAFDKIKRYIKHHYIQMIVAAIVIAICAFMWSKNQKDNQDFWKASANDIFTIFIAGFIAFFLTERVNDHRRKIDNLENLVAEIESMVRDDDTYKIADRTLLLQQSCANRIKYLVDDGISDIKADARFIDEHFQEIRNLYSEHKTNQQELESVLKSIDRHRLLIIDKCIKIRNNLYK